MGGCHARAGVDRLDLRDRTRGRRHPCEGANTLEAFKNGFIQALVVGPLIGLSQATALRDDTTRWIWWFAANVTTWLFGALSFEVGKWLTEELSLSSNITPAFPILAFVVHGVWMLWVTAPDAIVDDRDDSTTRDGR